MGELGRYVHHCAWEDWSTHRSTDPSSDVFRRKKVPRPLFHLRVVRMLDGEFPALGHRPASRRRPTLPDPSSVDAGSQDGGLLMGVVGKEAQAVADAGHASSVSWRSHRPQLT